VPLTNCIGYVRIENTFYWHDKVSHEILKRKITKSFNLEVCMGLY